MSAAFNSRVLAHTSYASKKRFVNYTTAFVLVAGLAHAAAVQAQTVTSTLLASSDDYSTVGDEVIFTATVTTSDEETPDPTGSITFYDGQSSIPGCINVALSSATKATCKAAALSRGGHYITANYSGDSDNPSSKSATLVQIVANPIIYTSNVSDNSPFNLAEDKNGNLYFSEFCDDESEATGQCGGIRKLTLNGTLTEINSDETYVLAGVVLDSVGDVYFVSNGLNSVFKLTPSTGIISHVAGCAYNGCEKPSDGSVGDGGSATKAWLYHPVDIAIDGEDNLYIADAGNHAIRKITQSTKIITTLNDSDAYPLAGVAVDSSGNVYAASVSGNYIFNVAANGRLIVVAGTGQPGYSGDGGLATSAKLNGPVDVSVDTKGNLYIADTKNHVVRKISKGIISTVAGTGTMGYSGDGGSPTRAMLNTPYGVMVDDVGTIYIADTGNKRVRRLDNEALSATSIASSKNPSTVSEKVTFTAGVVSGLTGSTFSPTGKVVFKDRGTVVSGCSSVTLSSGKATCTTNSLSKGSHSLTATYSGDIYNPASTSASLSQSVKE